MSNQAETYAKVTGARADKNSLPLGTRVRITANGVWGEGTEGTIEASYTIRYGHRMYDIRSRYGSLYTYYGPEQITVIEP